MSASWREVPRRCGPMWTSIPRSDNVSLPAIAHSDVMIDRNSFDTGPGPIFWLSDVREVKISANTIRYCLKALIYPSGGVLNASASSNAHGVELLEDNKMHAVDTPRLCVK